MKKFHVIFTFLVVLFIFSACQNQQKPKIEKVEENEDGEYSAGKTEHGLELICYKKFLLIRKDSAFQNQSLALTELKKEVVFLTSQTGKITLTNGKTFFWDGGYPIYEIFPPFDLAFSDSYVLTEDGIVARGQNEKPLTDIYKQ